MWLQCVIETAEPSTAGGEAEDLGQGQLGFPTGIPFAWGQSDTVTGIYVLHGISFIYHLTWTQQSGSAASSVMATKPSAFRWLLPPSPENVQSRDSAL